MLRMCITKPIYTAGETYALVDWVGEESSSVVQYIRVVGGVFTVGEVSKLQEEHLMLLL